MKRIGVIHATVNSVLPLEEAFASSKNDYEIVNFVDEHMLKRIRTEGGMSYEAKRAFTTLLFRVLDAKVDAIIIACTVYCTLEGLMREFTEVPILSIDAPMIEKAAQSGNNIGVLATNEETGRHTAEEIMRFAEALQRDVHVEALVLPETFAALRKGNGKLHDAILLEGAKELVKKGADLIVLAQITMARASDAILKENIPVLTSPDEGVRRIEELIV